MVFRYLLSCLLIIMSWAVSAQLLSPSEFLPSAYTKSFTFHHDLVDYVQHVSDNSPYAKLVEYGRTEEGRPLLMCFVSDPANLENLENIREKHLNSIYKGESTEDKAIVWLSFGVHGNEAGASESSMLALYQLVSEDRAKAWLKNTIVILDPCINPDGFARYTNWARMIEKDQLYPDPEEDEHQEPWPNGRYNHYLFDLNRDWVWQTQIESKQRLKAYRSWMPHVHGDFHEMNYNNHYYFPPAAKPYHPFITPFQKSIQKTFGTNNAKYFDKNNWLYFTAEEFDLFYPSYGDTYPMFNGAIGMTFEQAGHSMAGRAILTSRGDTLKLEDRILHHSTVALSTVEVASENAGQLIEEQEKYFKNSRTKPVGKFKSYVLKKGGHVPELIALLQNNGIEYSMIGQSSDKKYNGYEYQEGKNKSFELEAGDLVVDAFQNNSVLAQILLDPAHELEDSLTYDITAWSLPYAYNLTSYGVQTSISTAGSPVANTKTAVLPEASDYGIVIHWNGLQTAKLISRMSEQGIKMSKSLRPTIWNGKEVPPGSIFVWRKDQKNWKEAIDYMRQLLPTQEEQYSILKGGLSNYGNDAGGSSYSMLEMPKALAIKGDGVSVFDYGQTIYFFEKVLHLPIASSSIDRVSRIDLTKYNTIFLPSGSYALNEGLKSKLGDWVNKGGKLIVLGAACEKLVADETFGLKNPESEKLEARDTSGSISFSDLERKAISSFVPGAIVKTTIDNTHPLAYGMSSTYHMLVLEGSAFEGGDDTWEVAKASNPLQYEGFVGSQIKAELEGKALLLSGQKGKGNVVFFSNNPLFRGFWYSGMYLMANALFQL